MSCFVVFRFLFFLACCVLGFGNSKLAEISSLSTSLRSIRKANKTLFAPAEFSRSKETRAAKYDAKNNKYKIHDIQSTNTRVSQPPELYEPLDHRATMKC